MQRLAFPFPREITAGPSRLIKLEADVQENRVVVSGILEKQSFIFLHRKGVGRG